MGSFFDFFFSFSFFSFSRLFVWWALWVDGESKAYLYLALRSSHVTEEVKEGMGNLSITSFT